MQIRTFVNLIKEIKSQKKCISSIEYYNKYYTLGILVIFA